MNETKSEPVIPDEVRGISEGRRDVIQLAMLFLVFLFVDYVMKP